MNRWRKNTYVELLDGGSAAFVGCDHLHFHDLDGMSASTVTSSHIPVYSTEPTKTARHYTRWKLSKTTRMPSYRFDVEPWFHFQWHERAYERRQGTVSLRTHSKSIIHTHNDLWVCVQISLPLIIILLRSTKVQYSQHWVTAPEVVRSLYSRYMLWVPLRES